MNIKGVAYLNQIRNVHGRNGTGRYESGTGKLIDRYGNHIDIWGNLLDKKDGK